MGTDIHPYAEVLVEGKWVKSDAKVPDYRNYAAFFVLAGVRPGYGNAVSALTPIAEMRGLPPDLVTTRDGSSEDFADGADVWLGDHSHSWVLLSEMLAYKMTDEQRQEASLFDRIVDALKPLGDPDKVRLVFGFDS